MARPRSSNVKPVRKTLADGSVRIYYYDRASGNLLSVDNREAAIARATSAGAPANSAAAGTIAAVIADYRRSARFTAKAPGTRELYDRYLELIRNEWGDLPAASLRPKHVAAIQDRYAAHPRKANLIVTILRILMGVALRQELVKANPFAAPQMLPTPARTQLWSREDQDDFLAASDQRLHLACMLMIYTAQRLSDVLAMTKGQVYESNGRLMIELRQQKTSTLMAIPVHRDLLPMMHARLEDKSDGMLLIPSPTGLRWTRRNFSRKWDSGMRRMALRRARALFKAGWSKDRIRAELEAQHRQRRDLRRTSVVRMAELGLPTPQIAAISGHKIDRCQEIIDTYLPRRTEVAIAAMAAWEAAEDATTRPASRVVRLADHAQRNAQRNAPRKRKN